MFMPKFTLTASGGVIWIVICLFMISNKKYRKAGILAMIGMVLGLIIGNGILKNIVMRTRPYEFRNITLLIKKPWDYSFPSGHTLASFISAFIISFYHRKLSFLVYPLAIAIAFSRMYLYVHFPSDILASIVLAFLICLFVVKKVSPWYDKYYPRIIKKKNKQ